MVLKIRPGTKLAVLQSKSIQTPTLELIPHENFFSVFQSVQGEVTVQFMTFSNNNENQHPPLMIKDSPTAPPTTPVSGTIIVYIIFFV